MKLKPLKYSLINFFSISSRNLFRNLSGNSPEEFFKNSSGNTSGVHLKNYFRNSYGNYCKNSYEKFIRCLFVKFFRNFFGNLIRSASEKNPSEIHQEFLKFSRISSGIFSGILPKNSLMIPANNFS